MADNPRKLCGLCGDVHAPWQAHVFRVLSNPPAVKAITRMAAKKKRGSKKK